MPGTPERIRYYTELVAQWRPLDDVNNLTEDQRRGALLTRGPNGMVKIKSETGLPEVVLPQGFPARLFILRGMCGFSQQKLAEALGVTQQAVQHWEKGSKRPTMKRMQELAKVLRVSVGKLCDE